MFNVYHYLLDILSELFNQLDIHISLQQCRTDFFKHGI